MADLSSVTGTLAGLGPLLGPVGAIGGAGLSVVNSLLSGMNEKRRRETEVNEALSQNLANRQKLMGESPEANRQAASMALQSALKGSVNTAANAASGQAVNQGMGGDVVAPQAMAQLIGNQTSQAAAPYAQQLSGLYGQKAHEESDINQQLAGNTMDRARISQMTDYIQTPKYSPLQNVLSGAQAGLGLMGNMQTLFGGGDKTVGVNRIPEPDTTGMPDMSQPPPLNLDGSGLSAYNTNVKKNGGSDMAINNPNWLYNSLGGNWNFNGNM